MLSEGSYILRDSGAASQDDRMFVVKVYYSFIRLRRALGNLLLLKQFQKHLNCLLLIGQKFFSGQSVKEEQLVDSAVFLHDVGFLIDHCVACLTGKVSWEKVQKKNNVNMIAKLFTIMLSLAQLVCVYISWVKTSLKLSMALCFQCLLQKIVVWVAFEVSLHFMLNFKRFKLCDILWTTRYIYSLGQFERLHTKTNLKF